MRTLCVIPARAGSKGIPGKNLRSFCGVPLVKHTVEIARGAFEPSDIVVSTDGLDIATAARAAGAHIVLRPPHFAADDSPSELALLHALESRPERYDAVCMLQPTSPLVTSDDLRAAVDMCSSWPVDSVVSACSAEGFAWSSCGGLAKPVGWSPRQRPMRQVRHDYTENGAIYVTRTRCLWRTLCRTSGYTKIHPMPIWRSLQLDDVDDWAALECLHRQQCGEH